MMTDDMGVSSFCESTLKQNFEIEQLHQFPAGMAKLV
jgi:hypothetical protein